MSNYYCMNTRMPAIAVASYQSVSGRISNLAVAGGLALTCDLALATSPVHANGAAGAQAVAISVTPERGKSTGNGMFSTTFGRVHRPREIPL